MKVDNARPKSGLHVQCEETAELPARQAEVPNNEIVLKSKIRSLLEHTRRTRDAITRKLGGRTSTEPSSTTRRIPVSPLNRDVLIDERSNRPYIDNSIRSSRYTIYDFVPKQLLFQCTRLNNFYFIVIGIPQAIPGFSTTGNFTTILPLLFFILLTILKEGYDDLRRHRLDVTENKGRATILRRSQSACNWLSRLRSRLGIRPKLKEHAQEGSSQELGADQYMLIAWRDIRVGDVVEVKQNEQFPADVVLLSTSDEAAVALIETMALDGETNLKAKQAPCALRQCKDLLSINSNTSVLVVEQPNKDLYSFSGHIKQGEEVIALGLQQVVFRGSILRNTKHALGVVINTGEDCKIRMNANHHPQAKKPNLERWSNRIVLILIAYVVVLSIGSSIGYILWQNGTENRSWYLRDASVPFKQIIIGFGIMYNNIIPLAMYVSLEIVKLAQMVLISSDIHMFDESSQQKMRCNTNTILENLGQVEYVLSDKTGTLTENAMAFKGLSVAGRRIGHESIRDKSDSTSEKATASHSQLAQLAGDANDSQLSAKVRSLLLTMALCHTCLPAMTEHGTVDYQASSPDELALVEAAAELGFSLEARSSSSLTVKHSMKNSDDTALKYEILDVIEFSSDRKRMSILLRYANGQIWLLCKGADSVLIPRLQHSESVRAERRLMKKSFEVQRDKQRRSLQAVRAATHGRPSVALERLRHSLDVNHRYSLDSPMEESSGTHLRSDLLRRSYSQQRVSEELGPQDETRECLRHLEEFATEGLRTLMFARRELSQEEYAAWKKLSAEANSSVHDRDIRMAAAAESIEQSLELLGVTAIEDKLQREVPETIEKLRRANMHIWMLTGDKRETAISIAHSSRICCPESLMLSIDITKGRADEQLRKALHDVQTVGAHSVAVIDGHTLLSIEQEKPLLDMFYQLAVMVDSVICCRASPAQKAALVEGLRKHAPQKLVLTIGDGANDVAMIQAAHVGVGMMGREGMQAARVADYCIAQFSFLQRLLLVHGRWSYLRTAKFILNTFWKEMLFYLPQTLYQAHNGFSGSSLYENWSLTALNTLFTSLCVILPGIFEQDLKAETLLAVPELYVFGQKNRALNLSPFLLLMASATIEGMIIWHIPHRVYGLASIMTDNGAFALGHMAFSLAIVWTNWKLLLIDTHTKTKLIIAGFLITVAGWWAWSAFLAGVYTSNLSPFDVRGGFLQGFGRELAWWATFATTLAVLLLTDLLILVGRRYLIMTGWWPLWPAAKERRSQTRELEAWQEAELEHPSSDQTAEKALFAS